MRRHLGRARAVEVELPERPTAASLERWASGRGSATFEGVSRSRGALRASLQRRGRWRWPATLSTFSARCGHLLRKTRPNAGFLQMHNLQGLRLRHEAQDSYLHILIGGQRNRRNARAACCHCPMSTSMCRPAPRCMSTSPRTSFDLCRPMTLLSCCTRIAGGPMAMVLLQEHGRCEVK